ncbi:hypothetical protein Hdeb2414_s0028g00704861 [Helianthus debilis subsp. tardiflorus]
MSQCWTKVALGSKGNCFLILRLYRFELLIILTDRCLMQGTREFVLNVDNMLIVHRIK